MGWERKRGKLLDLNQLLRGAHDSFPIKVGNLSVLPDIRYVITLDSDTQLPRDSAAKLIGTLAHPLNRAVIDPATRMVTAGFGILQPRIGISIQSAGRNRLADHSGQTGFDIYTRAISDVYQDLFGEGIFTGKESTMWMPCTMFAPLPGQRAAQSRPHRGRVCARSVSLRCRARRRLPFRQFYSRRKHRWVRGDWQILRWLLSKVPDYYGHSIPNPISLISRWKILDNLRRSLIEPATLLLLLGGWFYLPGGAGYWTAAVAALLLVPAYANLLFSALRAPSILGRSFGPWAKDTANAFFNGHVVALLGIVFLLHQSLLSIDAIGRSMFRVFILKRRLLEWETAAQAETAIGRRATVDVYLAWSPVIAIDTVLLAFVNRAALPLAGPVLLLWFLSRWISDWLNRPRRTADRTLRTEDTELLRESAGRIWKFFADWSNPSTNWLIPDNVREVGAVAMRLSPTNLGFLLNARISAVQLGLLSMADFVDQTRKTLHSVRALEKYRGHLFNWYDVESLKPLEPRFVSTVDSGNLVACLWTLKQAALGHVASHASMKIELLEIASACELLVQQMDFNFLKRKKLCPWATTPPSAS
ncbi:MAG: hypothetical protein WKF37_09690 [Bryobacteraceae bacterium]